MITKNDLRPSVETATPQQMNSWQSLVRKHYSNLHGGPVSVVPTWTEFSMKFSRVVSPTFRFDPDGQFNLTSSDTLDQIFRSMVVPYSTNDKIRTYCLTIAALNLRAAIARHLRERICWNVSYICLSGGGNTYAEAKFHGRCMLVMPYSTFQTLDTYLQEQNLGGFMIMIRNIYSNLVYSHDLAYPEYNDGRALRAEMQRPAAPPPPPPPSTLRSVYANTSENTSSLDITKEQIKQMIDKNTIVNLDLIYDLLLAGSL